MNRLHLTSGAIICLENSEDIYAGIEYSPVSSNAEMVIQRIMLDMGRPVIGLSGILALVSNTISERFGLVAFSYRIERQRKFIIQVQSVNSMRFS